MVAWTDYGKDAQERGSLAPELFAGSPSRQGLPRT